MAIWSITLVVFVGWLVTILACVRLKASEQSWRRIALGLRDDL